MFGRDLAIVNSIALEHPIEQVFWDRKPRDVNGSGTEVECCNDFRWNARNWERKLRIKFEHVVVCAGASFPAAVFEPPKHSIQH